MKTYLVPCIDHIFSGLIQTAYEPRGPSDRIFSRFLYLEAIRSISTPQSTPSLPNGMLVHRRATPSIKFTSSHLYHHPGGQKHCERKLSCPRTKHNVPARVQTRTTSSGTERIHHGTPVSPISFLCGTPVVFHTIVIGSCPLIGNFSNDDSDGRNDTL